MAPNIFANNLIVEGLRNEFADTYSAVNNRLQNSRLSMVMDLNVQATNRYAIFGYLESAPHMDYWRRGSNIPTEAMGSVQFTVSVYEWAKRVPWLKWDRFDDQSQTLMEQARTAGQSAALLPERFFFDLLANTTNTLPAVPNAPDGSAFFASTTRFGASSGNLLSGSGITTIHDVHADFYAAVEQFKAFQDTKGQPLWSDDITDGEYLIIHAAADTEIFEQAFLQQRQAIGLDNTGARGGTVVAAAAETNLVQDASRRVALWGTQRLATGDWYVFLQRAPKKATFLLDRQGVVELSSLESDNSGDHTRTTAEEYIQWERRAGAGIALPYGAIKIDN